jgi:hypothetical protein
MDILQQDAQVLHAAQQQQVEHPELLPAARRWAHFRDLGNLTVEEGGEHRRHTAGEQEAGREGGTGRRASNPRLSITEIAQQARRSRASCSDAAVAAAVARRQSDAADRAAREHAFLDQKEREERAAKLIQAAWMLHAARRAAERRRWRREQGERRKLEIATKAASTIQASACMLMHRGHACRP